MKPPNRENKEDVSGIMDEFMGPSTSTEIQKSRPGQVLTALLASTQAYGRLPKISEGRAEELAKLLIKAVRQVHRGKVERVDKSG